MPRILVVDDEATLVATLRFNLEKEGLTVFTVVMDETSAVGV